MSVKHLMSAVVIVLTACQSIAPAARGSLKPPQTATPQYTKHTLIAFYDPETGSGPLLQAVKNYGAEVGYQYKNLNGISILLTQGQNIEAAQRHFRNVRGVLSVSRDHIMHLH